MNPSSLLRSLATAAAPLTVLALGLVVAAAATAGAAVESSPSAVASSAVLLVGLLGIGAAAVLALGRLREADRAIAPPVVAVVGTVLVAGGQWAALFVLPSLSEHAPQVLSSGAMASVTVGYVASYAVFALGWIATAATLLRARLVSRWLGALLLVVSIAATLVARRITVATPDPRLARTA